MSWSNRLMPRGREGLDTGKPLNHGTWRTSRSNAEVATFAAFAFHGGDAWSDTLLRSRQIRNGLGSLRQHAEPRVWPGRPHHAVDGCGHVVDRLEVRRAHGGGRQTAGLDHHSRFHLDLRLYLHLPLIGRR